MHVTHVFAGIAVSDFTAARDWYERLFDSPPDMFPTEGEAVWRPTASASIYITVDPERAGRALLTLAVKDLENERTKLVQRGLVVEDGAVPHGPRTLIVRDPDGNTIKLFEDPSSA